MNKTVIKVSNLIKTYRLGAIGGKTLREDLSDFGAKIFGKQKPKKGKFNALDGISFEVKKGEVLGIIGHNGAGKSTLLKLLSKITAPTNGTIEYDGRISGLLEIGTGFHPELTGRENVYLSGAILGMTKQEISKKFDQIVEFAGLKEFIDTPVKRYSSGMYVRLAFSVASHLDSEILIMDEVLAVGDASFQEKCISKMSSLSNDNGRTVLYVSHNMNTIRKLCSRCIVLDHGKIVFDGDTEKAIAVYIDKNFNKESCLDLANGERSDLLISDNLRFKNARYLNKDDCVFDKGSKVELDLQFNVKEAINDLAFRIVIKGFDDTPITAGFAYGVKSFSGENKARLEIDLSMLAPGQYKTYYVAFTADQYGQSKNYDSVRGLDLMIKDCEFNNKLIWREKAWGTFELPPIIVK